MSKKSRRPTKSRKSQAFDNAASGQFLTYLYGCQEMKPKADWNIPKQEVRIEFRKFLELPQNACLRERMPHSQRSEIGALLRKTGYLIDNPVGSDFFCINYQKLQDYLKMEELANDLNSKLLPSSSVKAQRNHRLLANAFFKQTANLPQFLPPPTLLELKVKKFAAEELCGNSPQFANYLKGGRVFTPENMHGAMKLLLQIEDVDILENYCRLIQRDVKLSQINAKKFKLKLHRKSRNIGCSTESLLCPFNRLLLVAESPTTKTLSMDFFLRFLLSGSMELKVPGAAVGTTYHGCIERLFRGDVTFALDARHIQGPQDAFNAKKAYLIIFCPARLTLRYQYNALNLLLDNLNEMKRFLFPMQPKPMPTLPQMCLQFYNKNIATNPEQRQAVHNIVSGSKTGQPLPPFIIFGPPGTGKTSIVVESIVQLLLAEPDAKVLVTTGPNSAGDEIALRICHTLALQQNPRSKILARIYCWSQERRRENINKLLLEYSNMYDWHFFPDVDILQQYRVVVCTLSTIGKMATGNLHQFTHIFLDEAAAASEAESLVGLMSALNERSKLIIAGDHKQLGSILNSKYAEELGLGVSVMERLLQYKCYAVDEADNYDRSIQARLCRNFRSHPAIVKLFGRMYYDDKLVATAPADEIDWSINWKRLKDTTFPILFHSVNGREYFDEETGSITNWPELHVVMSYVEELLQNGLGGRNLNHSDIGIISPYRSQYLAIQEELNVLQLFEIETGSVETYRGKEKPVIIVSFVRSHSRSLGFLRNPKRLNVILSRAKSLLILIGNDEKLSTHPDYKAVIEECQRHNNYIPSPKLPKLQK